jgi:hypothetical protein
MLKAVKPIRQAVKPIRQWHAALSASCPAA